MKKKQGGEHRWLVSYADYMTLLCAFFIMLYALQQVDAETGDAIRDRIEQHFSSNPSQSLVIDAPISPLAQGNGLLPMLRELQQIPQLLPNADDIQIDGAEDWVTVSLAADVLFAPGQTQLQAEALPLLRQIAETIRHQPWPVNVQGHSDDTPSRGALSNWDISALRAAAVAQQLVQEGVAPQRLAASGFSHYQPIHIGDDDEARAQNRRVVLYLVAGESMTGWVR